MFTIIVKDKKIKISIKDMMLLKKPTDKTPATKNNNSNIYIPIKKEMLKNSRTQKV
jgi:hypothetical protein